MLEKDRSQILSCTAQFKNLFDSKISVLGGTGFVGSWIVESIEALNVNYSANISLVLYSRNSLAAKKKFAHLDATTIEYIDLDLARSDGFQLSGSDFFIHGATPSIKGTGYLDSDQAHQATVRGAQLIREIVARSRDKSVVMHLSSGAVYGPQPLNLKNQPETEMLGEYVDLNSYAKSKIEAEKIITELNFLENTIGLNPRLFTFYGPGLSLVDHFAIGNFMGDILNNRIIEIRGNPQTVRSYLYPTDLIISLFALLSKPMSGAINIGSADAISILGLAESMNAILGGLGVSLPTTESLPSNYVPEVQFLRFNYGIKSQVGLEEGLLRWHEWLIKGDA